MILLVSPTWQTRALLAAELGERLEADVVSVADVDAALGLIKLAGVDPVAMAVDAGRQIGPGDVERLAEAKRDVPLVLVVSRLRREVFLGLRGRCGAFLVRPVRLGEIAQAIFDLLDDAGAKS